MNKKIVILIAGLVVTVAVMAGFVWFVLVQESDGSAVDTKVQDTNKPANNYVAKDACKYLTAAIADQLLGAGAEKGGGAPGASSEDVSVSVCTYSSKTPENLAGIKDMRHATLLLRSPLTAVGEESNDTPFATPKAGSQNVQGYGDKAFWDPELGQLNVLKSGTWAILSLGKTSPKDKTLDESKQLADLIIPKL